MKIGVVYISVTHGRYTMDYAARFAASWHQFPPGTLCELLVACNGGPPSSEFAMLFQAIGAKFLPRENDPGWDLSAYQDAAKGPCSHVDMQVCLGETVHFWRSGWLKRLEQAWSKHGVGMYGPFASNNVRPHLQTTAFACHPLHFRQWTTPFLTRQDRLAFEHGERALWRRLHDKGTPVRLVTWDGEYEPRMWRMPQDIIYRGSQSNCLLMANHADGFAAADENRKRSWAAQADRAFA